MKRLSASTLVAAALVLLPGLLTAEAARGARLPRILSRPTAAGQVQGETVQGSITSGGYSVQVNIVTKVQGSAFFRTSIDITNNTANDAVIADVQYCYTTVDGVFHGCNKAGTFTLTLPVAPSDQRKPQPSSHQGQGMRSVWADVWQL